MSYTIIQSASATSTSIDISDLILKKKYVCDTLLFNCTLQSTSSPYFATSTTKAISFDDAKNIYATKVSTITLPPLSLPSLPLTTIPAYASYITPSHDGNLTAFYTTTGTYGVRTARTYWMMSTSTKELLYFVEPIQKGWDLVSDASHVFSWNASSTILVYLSDRDGYPQLYKVDTRKKQITLEGEALATRKYTVADFIVVGNTVYFIANRENPFTYNLYKLPLEGKSRIEKIAEDVMYTNDLTISGNILLFTPNNAGVGVLNGYDTKTDTIQTFKGLDYSFVIGSTSQTISKPFFGRFFKGVTTNKKAVIWLHGGPYRQSADTRHSWGSYAMYDWMLEEAHKTGIAILKLDYPGSYGYGSSYANSIIGTVGDKDVESLKKAIAFLSQKGYNDITLFGVSYGGYLALKGAVEFPKKLTGSFAVAPVTDWKVLLDQVKPTPFEVEFQGKTEVAVTNLYAKADIIKKLSTTTPPIIIMQGDKDTSVPFDQSLYFTKMASEQGLSQNKISLFDMEGENHVLKDPLHIQAVCNELKHLVRSDTMSCEL